jgi:hypothetical protein
MLLELLKIEVNLEKLNKLSTKSIRHEDVALTSHRLLRLSTM